MKPDLIASACALAAAMLLAPAAMAVAVDMNIPEYSKGAEVSGSLSSVGSDTLSTLMKGWSVDFHTLYPGVKFQMREEGSSTAPPALTAGNADLAPMSRPMTDAEVAAFEKKYGYKPTKVPVAIDALSVYVSKDNPIVGLTLEQVDAIFSAGRKCGAPAAITTWGQAGLPAEWAKREIVLYGRDAKSGTHGYFEEHALCKGDFARGVKEQADSADLVKAIGAVPGAIGYAGYGFANGDVREVALSRTSHDPYVLPKARAAQDGSYPLSRFLYIYVNEKPGGALSPTVREFLRYVLSQRGQAIVVKNGFVPMQGGIVTRARKDAAL